MGGAILSEPNISARLLLLRDVYPRLLLLLVILSSV